jgi:hypothetical protein
MTQRPERSGFEFGKLEFVWDLGVGIWNLSWGQSAH